MKQFIRFTDEGESSEHVMTPLPTGLMDYLYSTTSKRWWDVQITTGINELVWLPVNEEDVPKGLRLLLMLINP